MISRSKFRSLTLINWNGFFARTFDLDEMVTTLSGGNGAGKSTTMAAFVTALIPDLTLLHFRNTTEAGATSGSRDKGLYGKLKPGVCYAVLDVINSVNQRVLCGVRLQQIAGRERKVDIKPFMIQGLEMQTAPVRLLTEAINDRQVKVTDYATLRERMESSEGTSFKQFSSITDYHAQLFELGVIPKRLRNASDRSKFYRLIEASLYGGISSAITRSLRDYLLPENSGVRKAFQDMEIALRENRMTLEAIKQTQADRDLFKHLISESTSYVAADYMRHIHSRKNALDAVLLLRRQLFENRRERLTHEENTISLKQRIEELQQQEANKEIDYQSANDHFSLVQTVGRQQEKIIRYQSDLEELAIRLEEQSAIVEEFNEQVEEHRQLTVESETEVDEIKSQLANYQQALDVQQTRGIQYQQALQSMERAKQACRVNDLSLGNLEQHIEQFQKLEQAAMIRSLELEQPIKMKAAAKEHYDEAYHLIAQLIPETTAENAWKNAKNLLKESESRRHTAKNTNALQHQYQELQQRVQQQQQTESVFKTLQQSLGKSLEYSELDEQFEWVKQTENELEDRLTVNSEQRAALRQEGLQLNEELQTLSSKIPHWIVTQNTLQELNEQLGEPITSQQQLTESVQRLLVKERDDTMERDDVNRRKQHLETQIERLNHPNGVEDGRLVALAEQFNGTLLCEIYDDISLEDAPYFSALYGPARNAIVVPSLEAVRESLHELEDCPDDLYFIEGDPLAFDDTVFNSEELKKAVIIEINKREWRYSKFPEIPMFGNAARESHLGTLRTERETLAERYATLSFDIQKTQRLYQQVSQFIGEYSSSAFLDNPEEERKQLRRRLTEVEREQLNCSETEQQLRSQYQLCNTQRELFSNILPHFNLLNEDTLEERLETIRENLYDAEEDERYILTYGERLQKLEKIANVLQNSPEQYAELEEEYQQVQKDQRLAQQQLFSLNDMLQRRTHFGYADSIEMLQENSDLNNKLRARLEQESETRSRVKKQLERYQAGCQQANQLYFSLKSAFETKNDLLKELQHELQEIGIKLDPELQEKALHRRDSLYRQLEDSRVLRSQLEKTWVLGESEIGHLQKRETKLVRDYGQVRKEVVMTKSNWCQVVHLVREHKMERHLYRKELLELNAEALRSVSDKALGSLRLAVADNEYLRDILRASEDPKFPEKKISFYLAVYQHLRDRIRHDILRTDDPIEAIEQMEIELARLTEELSSRETTLEISSKSVANIIRKTIQREQNRIRLLNQGLQKISFGQVQSVRLNVTIRESHATLLEVLSEQHEQHNDLFRGQKLTFSEAIATLYQRLNPQINTGQRTAQTLGEELLDYRNYLDLDIEVFRGTDGWLRAESGALSTGEAIGTGMAILVMVVQSWEEESQRMRGKNIIPCRLLFLDEAARLDGKSIATLFELCERLDMQLLIAAPENINPEKGTTYRLIRKVYQNQEQVHVVGLRGFSMPTDNTNTTTLKGQKEAV